MDGIEIVDGQASFFAFREPGWHRLGQVVQQATTIEEAIKLSYLDWQMDLVPVYAQVISEDGVTTVPVADRYAVIRKHPLKDVPDALGVVGSRYTLHTPYESAKFLDAVLGMGCQVETAGSLNDGKRVFITIKLPKGITVGGIDRSDLYAFWGTSYDGTTASTIDLTMVRVVCANTWAAAKNRSEAKWSLRHSVGLGGKAFEARAWLDLAFEFAGDMEEQASRLARTPMTNDDFASFVKTLVPFPDFVNTKPDLWTPAEKRLFDKLGEQRLAVAGLYLGSPTIQPEIKGTAWAAYNAVTEYADWAQPIKGDKDGSRQAARVLLGENADIKQRALNLLMV